MGLCPSRNKSSNSKFVEGKTYQPKSEDVSPTKLRADAQAFVPADQKVPKAEWEVFLDQKRNERTKKPQPFARRQDGTYTAEYRKLLESSKPTRNPTLQQVQVAQQAATGTVSADFVQAWKECAPGPARKPANAKAAKKAGMPTLDPLQQAIRKARVMPKEQLLELLAETKSRSADDLAVPSSLVPFGLTDRHYWSGEEDDAKSNAHRSLKPTPQREYVTAAITAELEETMTEVLYKLRLLRTAEAQSRRYCVGLREVMRASKEPGALKAVLVAPDLEPNSGRGLDEKLQQLVATCKQSKTPVVFGLSRLRLGQAVKKSVTVSVLGILDTRGVQGTFDRMVELA